MRFISIIFYILFFGLFASGCQKKKTSENIISEKIILDSIAKNTDRISLTKLMPEIDKKLSINPNYKLLKEEITSLNKSSYGKMGTITSNLNETTDELITTFPEEVKNNAILSRLNELKTYSLQLQYLTSLKEKDTLLFNKKAKKILSAYNKFAEQANDFAYKRSEEVEKELQKNKKIRKDTLEVVEPLF